MKRREFIGLIGTAALSFSPPAHAQTKTAMPLVGLLLAFKPDTTVAQDRITAIRKGLQEEGFIESTNYSLAVRLAEGDINRYPRRRLPEPGGCKGNARRVRSPQASDRLHHVGQHRARFDRPRPVLRLEARAVHVGEGARSEAGAGGHPGLRGPARRNPDRDDGPGRRPI